MITLQGDLVRMLVLQHIVHLIETGQYGCLITSGLDPALLDRLRKVSFSVINGLSKMNLSIQVAIDNNDIAHGLDQIETIMRAGEQYEEFVKRGASKPMLRALFNKGEDEIDNTRQLLNVPTVRGRPSVPRDPEIREAIHQKWLALAGTGSLKERYLLLHDAFEQSFSLATLWNIVNGLSPVASGLLEVVH